MSIVQYVQGDLFQITNKLSKLKSPLLLAHACNCLGVWGGGIALVFKKQFYSTYELYRNYCHSFASSPSELLGTSLLLPVSMKDQGYVNETGGNMLVVCLFTSVMGQEPAEEIAKYTELALVDLKKKLLTPELIENINARQIIVNYENKLNYKLDESAYLINMPKINAGIFGVPWNLTESSLKRAGLPCRVFEL